MNEKEVRGGSYPTILRLTVNAHLDDALEFLRLSVIAGARKDPERDRLFATASMVHAFQATEDFLGVVRARYIVAHKNTNPQGAHAMFDFLSRQLGDVRPIQKRWKAYAKLMVGVDLGLGSNPFLEYTAFARFRNTHLHAQTVWVDAEENDGAMDEFPDDPSEIRTDHATKALEIAGAVIQKGIEVFGDYVPSELHDDRRLSIFKKAPDGTFHKTPFPNALRRAVEPLLSEELDFTVSKVLMDKLGANLDHCVPPTASDVTLSLHLDGTGHGYYGVRGYKDQL